MYGEGGAFKTSGEISRQPPPKYVCFSSQRSCCVSGEDEGELRHVAHCRLLTAWSHLPPPARARGGRCGLGGPRRVTRSRRGPCSLPTQGRAAGGWVRTHAPAPGRPFPAQGRVNRVVPSALPPPAGRRRAIVADGLRWRERARAPARPASSVFVLMEPACSWRVSSHVPRPREGLGAGERDAGEGRRP